MGYPFLTKPMALLQIAGQVNQEKLQKASEGMPKMVEQEQERKTEIRKRKTMPQKGTNNALRIVVVNSIPARLLWNIALCL